MSLRRAVGAALLVALSACAPRAPGPEVGPLPSEGIPVRVENGTSGSLRVFVMTGGGDEVPLGRVGALGTSTFRLPSGVSGSLRLVVRPSTSRSGGERHVSEPFTLTGGHRATWRLRASPGVSNLPSISSVSVFDCEEADC